MTIKIMTIKEAINTRLGCRFVPRQWVEGDMFDCVTFIASVYRAAGVIDQIDLPEYRVYGKGLEMRDLTCTMIEGTGAFTETDQLSEGCAVVFSHGNRGHHAGIFLAPNEVAHCAWQRGVVIDSFIPPLSENVFKIYEPI